MIIVIEVCLLCQIAVLPDYSAALSLIFPVIVLVVIDDIVYFVVIMELQGIHSAGFLELAEYKNDFFLFVVSLTLYMGNSCSPGLLLPFLCIDGCSQTFICRSQI